MSVEQNSLDSLVLPAGWFCLNVSAQGVGMYEKWIKKDLGKGRVWVVKYRAVYTPFSYGWTLQTKSSNSSDWNWFMAPTVFPSHIGAIVALEMELSNNSV